MTTLWPINPTKKLPYTCQGVSGSPAIEAASSMHPGGANFAMMDGSVRFMKETIDSWQNRLGNTSGSYTCLPPGLTQTTVNNDSPVWSLAAGNKLGVYQALSTRAGGEVISSDQY